MSELQSQQHGRNEYFLEDEGYISDTPAVSLAVNNMGVLVVENLAVGADSTATDGRLAFKFGRMFKESNIVPVESGLEALGAAMITKEAPAGEAGAPELTSELPSGYTFLGQFIDHDMTFDSMKIISEGEVDVDTLISKRSPTLDLDSLYGQYYLLSAPTEVRYEKKLYEEADMARLKIGKTGITVIGDLIKRFANDLPRDENIPRKAIAVIADQRNDENLGIAQTHVAFLKFHNAVVEHLRAETEPSELFEAARQTVVKHYQWIILHDFLPRILDREILRAVIASAENGGAGPTWLADETKPYMPVEFAGAAFRFGHSLLRDAYEWNRVFESPPRDILGFPVRSATLGDLFEFTGRGGMVASVEQLPNNWIIDWRRFYDFSFYGIPPHPKFNVSRKIDTFITPPLGNIPNPENEDSAGNAPVILDAAIAHLTNLPIRNLKRGRLLKLPTGQEVFAILLEQGKVSDEQRLTEEEITGGTHGEILKLHGFDKETPLWYYILKEAEIKGEGNHLGAVGSYIVAETIVKFIQLTEISILNEIWEPTLAPEDAPRGFEMADLIKFTDNPLTNPLINPLGETQV